jgi:hypothetical protein
MSTRYQRELQKHRVVVRGEGFDRGVGAIYWNERDKRYYLQSPDGRYPLRIDIPEGPITIFLREFQETDKRVLAEWDALKKVFKY